MSANPFPEAWRQFKAETAEHVLTIHHDDGLYRHLKMGKPGTGIWSWSLATWPGHMALTGDIGRGYLWRREADMLEWADTSRYPRYDDGAPAIPADYWAEKLTGACRDSAQRYSPEVALRLTREKLTEDGAPGIAMVLAAASIILDDADESVARDWLYEQFPNSNTWEWDLTEFDLHYLLACYAVAHTIRAYRSRSTHSGGAQ